MRYAHRLAGRVLLACVMLAAFFGAATPTTAAEQPDSKGKDFWLAFPRNSTTTPVLRLFIASETAASGTVEIPLTGFSQAFNVIAGTITTVTVPNSGVNNAHLTATDGIQNRGIHVTADAEVTVHGLNRIDLTTDGYLGLPTDLLGTEYIVLSYQSSFPGSEFAIVGTMDDTSVWITPAATTGARAAGIPYEVILDRGQTYQLANNENPRGDLTGTIISADNPIAVFGAHQCTNVPPAFGGCDHLVEQLPPTSTWDTEFVTMPLRSRLNGDTFRFLAREDNTEVSVDGVVVAALNRGKFHERIITAPAHITATRPILVAQYANGDAFDSASGIGDPFMMLIQPVDQFDTTYGVMNATLTTPSVVFTRNFINVVAPAAAVGTITLDGPPILAALFSPIGSSAFSGTQLSVTPGPHHLAGPIPFGVSVYGFRVFDSYGYPGGLSLAPRVKTITLSQETDINRVGTLHCVVATVLDQFGEPMEGVSVSFAVEGPNETTGVRVTGGDGKTDEFCYTGLDVGDETIVGSSGIVVSNELSKTWFRIERITLVPETGINLIGTEHCVVATVFDENDIARAGVPVDFTITGPNATSGSVDSDANGSANFCYTGVNVGIDTIVAAVGDASSNVVTKTWFDNRPPDISNAAPTQACFWPPNHQFASVGIVGVTDPDGDPLTIMISGITSDEPTASAPGVGGGNHAPDAVGVSTDTASIRVERSGRGDGRVYVISFEVSDGQETVSGSVAVGVPHDQRGGSCGIDSGQDYDATRIN